MSKEGADISDIPSVQQFAFESAVERKQIKLKSF